MNDVKVDEVIKLHSRARYPRPRIDALLADAFLFPVVVVSGGMGSAKTLETRHHVERLGMRHRVYTLHERNSSLAGFMRGLAIVTGVGSGVGADMLSTQEQSEDLSPEQITSWLTRRLDDAQHTIIIDDFHKIRDERIIPLLDRLIRNTVPLRWVIITREPERLPIEKWVLDGFMRSIVAEEDLRFTFSEALDFLRTTGVTESVDDFAKMANGWPIALSLLGTLGSQYRDPQNAHASQEYSREKIYDLLRDNVFKELAPADQSFLLQTCITETVIAGFWPVHASGAKAPFGVSQAPRTRAEAVLTLRRLAAQCSQIAEIEDGVWQYHDTFRQFLLQELHSRGRDRFDTARLLGAKRYEAIGYHAEAMSLYIELGRKDDVIALLRERGIKHFLERGHVDPLRYALRWLGDLDGDDPVLLALDGAVIINDGKYDLGLARIQHGLSKAVSERQYAEIACLLAYQLVRGVDSSRRAFMESLLTRDFLTNDERASILGRLAMAYLRDGDGERARATLDDAYTFGSANEETKALLDSLAALLAQCNEDYATCLTLLQSARQVAVKGRLFRLAISIERQWYETHYEMDDLRECQIAAERMLQFGAATGDRHDEQRAVMVLLSLASQRGDDDELARLQQLMEPHILADDTIWYQRIVPIVHGLADAWAGDFKGALAQLRGTSEHLRHAQQRSRWAQIALFAAAAGEHDEAWEALREAKPTEPVRNWRTARNVMRCAIAAALLGDTAQARSLLDRLDEPDVPYSPHFVASLRATRAFVSWLAHPTAEEALVLYDAIKAIPRDGRGFARLLSKLRAMNPLDRAFATLTQTERQILRLLIGGHDEAEIAQATKRAQHTVKNHIQTICGRVGLKKAALVPKAVERQIAPLNLFTFTMQIKAARDLSNEEIATLQEQTGATIAWSGDSGSALFVRDGVVQVDAVALAKRDIEGLLDGAGVEVVCVECIDPLDQDWQLSH